MPPRHDDPKPPPIDRAQRAAQRQEWQSIVDAQSSRNRNYALDCQCGREHVVTAAQAGGAIKCNCGAIIDVPPLSRLRASAGQEPTPLSTVERIRAMIAANELASGDTCACCGGPAKAVAILHIECERSRVESTRWPSLVVRAALMLVTGVILLGRWPKNEEEHGLEISVDVPLRLSPDCRDRLLRVRKQRELKRLLVTVPIYEQLLDEFPGAVITHPPTPT